LSLFNLIFRHSRYRISSGDKKMSVAQQLYQLQEVDLEIESDEKTLDLKTSQLGDNQALVKTQAKLDSEQKQLDEQKHRQRAAEWEIDDLASKTAAIEDQLYGGKINNPKELSGLQHEVNTFKAQRDQLETKALEIMEQVELAEASVVATSSELKQLEEEWHRQQQQLATEIDQLKSKLSNLKQQRQTLADAIDPKAVASYEKLRKQKGQPVARVEQGICRGCRISLPANELQQARGGNLVQCGSCGRILYLP